MVFFPSSNVNVDLTKQVKRNFIKSGHCCRQCHSIVPCLSEFSSTLSLINLPCFFLFFISLYRLLVWVLSALFVICLSLKDLLGLVNCLIACVYFVQILKMVPIHCAASTQPGYSRCIFFSTQMISSLFLWAVNVHLFGEPFVYLILWTSEWNVKIFTKLKTLLN